ncbi:Gfo/Idh/MocA family oxidoreductase [Actinomycetaceae bacterium TAE3-ERU4]|nr:Gfo/Idh/MocA family oxidoreductase [Actinomycetaceae bacterium TAE3-ERU4]
MSTRTLRVGVIGVGARSRLALNALSPENNCALVAVVETCSNAKERVEKQLGKNLKIFSTLEELIEEGIDIAFITSPDDTHQEVAVRLLRAGIAVYLEKPLAITREGADEILRVAYETKTKLYVGHNMRHMQVVRLLREIIQRGEIGEVKAIWCRHFVGSGGDFYFKDWHSQRKHVGGLLLQKAAHDIDVMNWLANSHPKQVVGMGGLTVYNQVTNRGGQGNKLMGQWHSLDNWPPLSQTGLSDKIDIEDISMMLMQMENGVFASYQQCHYTPDYWRNYTVIGTAGRAENFGDGQGGHIKVWNKRTFYNPDGDLIYPIEADAHGHDDADKLTVKEFIRFVRDGSPTDTNPLAAWHAVNAGIGATDSLRTGSSPVSLSSPPTEIETYFENNQLPQ